MRFQRTRRSNSNVLFLLIEFISPQLVTPSHNPSAQLLGVCFELTIAIGVLVHSHKNTNCHLFRAAGFFRNRIRYLHPYFLIFRATCQSSLIDSLGTCRQANKIVTNAAIKTAGYQRAPSICQSSSGNLAHRFQILRSRPNPLSDRTNETSMLFRSEPPKPFTGWMTSS